MYDYMKGGPKGIHRAKVLWGCDMATAVVNSDVVTGLTGLDVGVDVGVDVEALFLWLRKLDLGSCTLEMVTSAMMACRPVRGWLDVMDARIRARDRELRELRLRSQLNEGDPPEGASSDDSENPPGDRAPEPPPPDPPPPLPGPPAGSGPGGNPLNDSAGVGHGEGRLRDQVSVIIERFGGLDELLASGTITSEHLHAICRALHHLDPLVDAGLNDYSKEIVAHAKKGSSRQLRRYLTALITSISSQLGIGAPKKRHRSTVRHWIDKSSGTGKVFADLHPDDYQGFLAIISAAQHQIAASMPSCEPEELAAVALLGLIGAGDQSIAIRAVAHVSVLIDAATLAGGPHGASICEYADGTPINPDDFSRITCGADHTPILLKDRVPIDVGRTQRLATAAQHRAIEALHTTCVIADCTVPVTMCELHHVHHWEHGGLTNLANLIPMCSYHHHRSHEQRWQHIVNPDRSISTTVDSGGKSVEHTTFPDRLAS